MPEEGTSRKGRAKLSKARLKVPKPVEDLPLTVAGGTGTDVDAQSGKSEIPVVLDLRVAFAEAVRHLATSKVPSPTTNPSLGQVESFLVVSAFLRSMPTFRKANEVLEGFWGFSNQPLESTRQNSPGFLAEKSPLLHAQDVAEAKQEKTNPQTTEANETEANLTRADLSGRPEMAVEDFEAYCERSRQVAEAQTVEELKRFISAFPTPRTVETDPPSVEQNDPSVRLEEKELPETGLMGLIPLAEKRILKRQKLNVADMQQVLNAAAGTDYGDFKLNSDLAKRIKGLAENSGVVLLYEGQPVKLRCSSAVKTGYFEARSGAQGKNVPYQGTAFPRLTASVKPERIKAETDETE